MSETFSPTETREWQQARRTTLKGVTTKGRVFHSSPASPWPTAASSIWRRYNWLYNPPRDSNS